MRAMPTHYPLSSQEFWNSFAAVTCSREGRPVVSTVGRLHEMIDYLLSRPAELHDGLQLESEVLKNPLGRAEVEALRRRGDFPLVV